MISWIKDNRKDVIIAILLFVGWLLVVYVGGVEIRGAPA